MDKPGDWESMAKSYATKRLKTNSPTDENDNGISHLKQEDIKIEQLKAETRENPGIFSTWEALIKTLRLLPERKQELIETYAALLNEFPLLFGYWQRYANVYAEKGDYDKANEIYKEAITHLKHNPEIWVIYLNFVLEKKTFYSIENQRSIIDQALENCGKHWLSWSLWNVSIKFEEEQLKKCMQENFCAENSLSCFNEALARISRIYYKALSTPFKDLSKCWEKFKSFATLSENGSFFDGWQNLPIQAFDLLMDDELLSLETAIYENNGKFESENQKSKAKEEEKSKLTDQESKENLENGVQFNFSDGTTTELFEQDFVDVLERKNTSFLQQVFLMVKKKRDLKSVSSSLASANDFSLFVDGVKMTLSECERFTNFKELKKLKSSKLIIFEGAKAVKHTVDTLSGSSVAEQWCLEYRHRMYDSTLRKVSRWQKFEDKLSRSFFHPAPLKPLQIITWREYLDAYTKEEESSSIDFLYHRCLEVCANYLEFWKRYASYLEDNGHPEAAVESYKKLCNVTCKQRPDFRLEYAEFCEKIRDLQEASTQYEILCENNNPGSHLLDVWLKRIGFYRRQLKYDTCTKLYLEANDAIKDLNKRAVLAIEESKHHIAYTKDYSKAINLLKKEWQLNPTHVALFKCYVNTLEHFGDKANLENDVFNLIEEAYQQMLGQELKITTAWNIWRNRIEYQRFSCKSINSYIETMKNAKSFFEKNQKKLLSSSLETHRTQMMQDTAAGLNFENIPSEGYESESNALDGSYQGKHKSYAEQGLWATAGGYSDIHAGSSYCLDAAHYNKNPYYYHTAEASNYGYF